MAQVNDGDDFWIISKSLLNESIFNRLETIKIDCNDKDLNVSSSFVNNKSSRHFISMFGFIASLQIIDQIELCNKSFGWIFWNSINRTKISFKSSIDKIESNWKCNDRIIGDLSCNGRSNCVIHWSKYLEIIEKDDLKSLTFSGETDNKSSSFIKSGNKKAICETKQIFADIGSFESILIKLLKKFKLDDLISILLSRSLAIFFISDIDILNFKKERIVEIDDSDSIGSFVIKYSTFLFIWKSLFSKDDKEFEFEFEFFSVCLKR